MASGQSAPVVSVSMSQMPAQAVPKPEDCLACRVIGTAALAGVGIHALNQSRVHQPGSPVGKRMMAGLGVCFLVGSALRWTK